MSEHVDTHRDDDDPTVWDLEERDRFLKEGLLEDSPDPTEVLVEDDQ